MRLMSVFIVFGIYGVYGSRDGGMIYPAQAAPMVTHSQCGSSVKTAEGDGSPVGEH